MAHPTPPMARVDGCPECVLNTEPPLSTEPVEDSLSGASSVVRCLYLCTDCGHSWTTDWRD